LGGGGGGPPPPEMQTDQTQGGTGSVSIGVDSALVEAVIQFLQAKIQ